MKKKPRVFSRVSFMSRRKSIIVRHKIFSFPKYYFKQKYTLGSFDLISNRE